MKPRNQGHPIFNLRQLHEVYIELKALYTVAFHYEGSYMVTATLYNQKLYGFPLPCTPPQTNLQTTNSKISQNRITLETDQCQVKHNSQMFVFQSKACFRIETSSNPQITVLIELVKLPEKNQSNKKQTLDSSKEMMKQNRNFEETQDINDVHTSHKKMNSSTSPTKKLSNSTHKKNVVASSTITINTSIDAKDEVEQQSKKVIFSKYQYFSTLYLTITHAKLGYQIRNLAGNFTEFGVRNHEESLNDQPKRIRQFTNSDKEKIIATLRNWKPTILSAYKKLIIQQIMTFKKLTHHYLTVEQSQKVIPLYRGHENFFTELCNIPKSQQKLLINFQAQNIQQLYYKLFLQSKALELQIKNLWHRLIQILRSPRSDLFYYKHLVIGFQKQIKYLLQPIKIQRSLNSSFIAVNNLLQNRHKEQLRYLYLNHDKISDKKYLNNFYELMPEMEVIEKNMRSSIQENRQGNQQILMNSVNYERTLFVLVHGLNGSEYDLSMVKAFINTLYTTNILPIRTIQSKFHQSTDELGKYAAQEIISYIINSDQLIQKINFIGYSLGGIIIRASLKYLKQYSHMFNILMTLSTPHLGITENQSCIVRTYTKVVNKVSKNEVMKELSLNDQGEEGSFLERLSRQEIIGEFKLVILIGSAEDIYVPLYSSALQYHQSNPRILQMQQIFWKNLQNLHIINTKFNIRKTNLMERILMKKVHCSFLEDMSFLYFLFYRYYFDF